MAILDFVQQNVIIIIPVLLVLGAMLKGTEKVPDKWIPIILLPVSILLVAGANKGFSVDVVIQGVLCAGTAVYGNQVYKQFKKVE